MQKSAESGWAAGVWSISVGGALNIRAPCLRLRGDFVLHISRNGELAGAGRGGDGWYGASKVMRINQ